MKTSTSLESATFAEEQAKDPELVEIIKFLTSGQLPADDKRAQCLTLQGSQFALQDWILFYLDPKAEHHKRAVVPNHLQLRILQETHSSRMSGHFAIWCPGETLVVGWDV